MDGGEHAVISQENYLKYRGKCREFCEAAIAEDPSLTLVRGYYHDAFWGKHQHFWTVRADGSIFDPTKAQFPDQGGDYEEFDGTVECEQCGKRVDIEDATRDGNHVFCSSECQYACCM
jgi:hypothetical protein